MHPLYLVGAAPCTETSVPVDRRPSQWSTINAIVRATAASVPGFNHVGVSVIHRDGWIDTLAATDQLAWDLDALQYDLAEGPCLAGMRESLVVLAPHFTRDDLPWPRYVRDAARLGVRSQLSLRLYADDDMLGALNLYSTCSAAIHPDAVHIAEQFATHVALALGRSRCEAKLDEAMGSRHDIGVAMGLIMARGELDEHAAFLHLVEASSDRHLSVREIARGVTNSA